MEHLREGNKSITANAAAKGVCHAISSAAIALLLGTNCFAEPIEDSITNCEKKALEEVYGTYVYDEPRMPPSELWGVSVEETYRNYERTNAPQSHLLTGSYAGIEVSIDPARFRGADGVVVNPVYVVSCYRTFVEGHIPSYRWSNEGGYGVDREVIDVLRVYPPEDIHRQWPLKVFEIVGEDLWYGGITRLYIARRKD